MFCFLITGESLMERKIVEVIGIFFRILLRYWAKDSENRHFSVSDFADIEQFAEKCGLSFLEAKKFNRTVESFIDAVAKEFIYEIESQVKDKERKKAILDQIREDIQKINLDEKMLIASIHNSNEMSMKIMEQSKRERELWSETEIGLYSNCVKYISKMGIDFVAKFPDFSSSALSIIIQRQEEYFEELQSILSDIYFMTCALKGAEDDYYEFESMYREKVIDKYGKVELIGAKIQDRHIRKYDIMSAYVELNCIEDRTMKEIELSNVFDTSNVIWIKGDAGAGKTTFLQWVAICSAKGEYTAIKNIENTIPIVIGLRNIDWPFNLSNIIDKVTASEGVGCPKGWVQKLLAKQEAILLFDGFDEISITKREDIYTYIEELTKKYPKIKILLTARNSVRDNIECTKTCYEIVPMKMERIKEFVEYWHKSVLRHNAIESDEEINDLKNNLICKIVENPSLKDLAKNPLLCALLCALNYINNKQLPENKMQLFEQCCEMLMDARDSQRNIDVSIYNNVPKLDYRTKRRILDEIAFRMLKNGVSSENRSTVEEFLHHLLEDTNIIPNHHERYDVGNVLNFLIERSGIIREPEEGVISFIHKTFMEFLAVKAICRNCDWDILVKEACNVNWRETIIMCFDEMGNSNIDYVLKNLVEKAKMENDDRYILMSSLCVSNTKFFCSPIKKEIDKKINEMIPPSDEKIEEMAELGSYLLSFLKNSSQYTTKERYNCLITLANIDAKEKIPVILSYIKFYSDTSDIYISKFATELLLKCEEVDLDEYNTKGHLARVMMEYIYTGNELLACDAQLYLLNDYHMTEHEANAIRQIKKMVVLCQDSKIPVTLETNIGEYFEMCETVCLVGDTNNFSFIKEFKTIKNLEIKSKIDFSTLTCELQELRNLRSVATLYIDTDQHEIYFISRVSESMKNLKLIEIYSTNQNLSLAFDTFDNFAKLDRVVFIVNTLLAKEIEKNRDALRGNNRTLEICVRTCDE